MDMDGGQMNEFLEAMMRFTPAIPEDVISYYLQSAGFASDDPRIVRMVALAAQKFVLDVGHDAKLYQNHRLNAQGGAPNEHATLTMEDLAASLREYGVNFSKPEYFCDSDTTLQAAAATAAQGGAPISAKGAKK
ncbi:transcription initiation factor TFIID subunit [Achlya hypogyna]|uniref:Transcription initiation factor TFIID subunit n=1 Tax=Achlya hypogyna TaxID=1202772 RepID=A0A1V9Z3Z1_ACHHY|nr:transcription initiation factor TFIID subunit [Achlya hypogyna]